MTSHTRFPVNRSTPVLPANTNHEYRTGLLPFPLGLYRIVAVVHMAGYDRPNRLCRPGTLTSRRVESPRASRCDPAALGSLSGSLQAFPLLHTGTQSRPSGPWSGHLPRTLPRWFSKRASGHLSACTSPDTPFSHAWPAGPSLPAVPVTLSTAWTGSPLPARCPGCALFGRSVGASCLLSQWRPAPSSARLHIRHIRPWIAPLAPYRRLPLLMALGWHALRRR